MQVSTLARPWEWNNERSCHPLPSSYHHRESCFALLITQADGGQRLVLTCRMPQVQAKYTAPYCTAPRSFQLDSAAQLPLCVARPYLHMRPMSSYAIWAIMGGVFRRPVEDPEGYPEVGKARYNNPPTPSYQRGYSIRCGCGVGSSRYPRESQSCKHTARPLDRGGRRVTTGRLTPIKLRARIRRSAAWFVDGCKHGGLCRLLVKTYFRLPMLELSCKLRHY